MASSSRSDIYPNIIDLDADDKDEIFPKGISHKNMASSSRSNIYPNIIDVDADNKYEIFPKGISLKNIASSSKSKSYIYPNIIDLDAYDKYEIFPIFDEKYAEELQLQEALIFSASHTNASSPSQINASSSSSSIPETSSTRNKLKRKRSMVIDEASAHLPDIFCAICMDTKPQSEMFSNSKVCSHQFCSDCIRQHVSVKIKENIANVKCPDPNCKRVIRPELCRTIVPKEVIERWEDALCESMILATQKFYCPFKDCSAMLVDDSRKAVTSCECPNCNRLFCAKCKVAWHSGMNCSEFKRRIKKDVRNSDKMLTQLAKKKRWRRCPNCKIYVAKQGGCNDIACRCGSDFCYRCGKDDCVCPSTP